MASSVHKIVLNPYNRIHMYTYNVKSDSLACARSFSRSLARSLFLSLTVAHNQQNSRTVTNIFFMFTTIFILVFDIWVLMPSSPLHGIFGIEKSNRLYWKISNHFCKTSFVENALWFFCYSVVSSFYWNRVWQLRFKRFAKHDKKICYQHHQNKTAMSLVVIFVFGSYHNRLISCSTIIAKSWHFCAFFGARSRFCHAQLVLFTSLKFKCDYRWNVNVISAYTGRRKS